MLAPRKRTRFLAGIVAVLALSYCGRQAWGAPPASFPDEQTVAQWLFDDESYPHTPLLDSSLGEYDLRLLRGRLTRGRYGGALQCDPMAGGYNVYFSEWEGKITAEAMRIFAPEPSGLWGPTLVPDRLLEALTGEAWTCEFWIQALAPDAYVAFVWRMGADNVRETELAVSRNGLDWSFLGDKGMYLAKNSAAQGRRFAE